MTANKSIEDFQKVEFTTTSRTYPVFIGANASSLLAHTIASRAQQVAFVTQRSVVESGLLDRITKSIARDGLQIHVSLIGEGEAAKSLATVETLCSRFADAGLTRKDVVVCVGGGMVTDVGGFAASVYHRGVDVIHIPTTLLGQVDAALGGKTGVNLASGKNLVGSFWQPLSVLCDTTTLETLPESELISGLGEVAKYHFIASAVGLEPPVISKTPTADAIAQCVAIKAAYVGTDERESGMRALLNYGHTLAHALEIQGGFGLRHGEAVAVGIDFAARLALKMGRINEQRVADHRSVLAAYGLSFQLPTNIVPTELIEIMAKDKKSSSAPNNLTFVLDTDIGGRHQPELVTDVPKSIVLDVLSQ